MDRVSAAAAAAAVWWWEDSTADYKISNLQTNPSIAKFFDGRPSMTNISLPLTEAVNIKSPFIEKLSTDIIYTHDISSLVFLKHTKIYTTKLSNLQQS